MIEKHKALFIVGGPGSGKGTICEYLVSVYGFKHLSTGDLLRAEVNSHSDLGKFIDSLISKGNLVPGHISADLLKKGIMNSPID